MKARVLLAATLVTASSALAASAPTQSTHASQNAAVTIESNLSLQVAEIASSTKLSAATKLKRIADLVRRTVISATSKVQDPEQAVAIAVQLATAAARAAPEYTQLIVNTVVSIPSIASIDGAMGAVSSAVVAAANPDTQEEGRNSEGRSRGEPREANPPGSGGGGGTTVGSISK